MQACARARCRGAPASAWPCWCSCCVASCMRRPNCAFSSASSSVCSSAGVLPASPFLVSFAFHRDLRQAEQAVHERRAHRQLGGGERERLARQRLVHAVHLVEHLARLDLGDVVLRDCPCRCPCGLRPASCEIGLSGKMRIQMRPPRLMWRVIARRAASIWRAVSRPRPIAFRPYSPKLTLLPTVATPLLRPFCSLRYFRLAGCSILRSCSWRRAVRRGRFGASGAGAGAAAGSALCAITSPLNTHTLMPITPYVVLRFGEAVVDVGAQRVQRHAAFAIPLACARSRRRSGGPSS